MAIIAISGCIGSEKDTVANIIQYLTLNDDKFSKTNEDIIADMNHKWYVANKSDWKIKKFLDKLKQIVALLIGCKVEDLESQEFKASPLGKEWLRYSYADGFKRFNGETTMLSIECDKETYDYQFAVNWQTAYQTQYNPRMLMQFIGTDLLRNQLLQNVWVNALFADYKGSQYTDILEDCPRQGIYEVTEEDEIMYGSIKTKYPNWIITDVRYPNELQAIKERNGIVIRINRDSPVFYKYYDYEVKTKLKEMGFKDLSNGVWEELAINEGFTYSELLCRWSFDEDNIVEHESETALDNSEFDYVLDNNSDIPHLIEEVRKMLVHFNIL